MYWDSHDQITPFGQAWYFTADWLQHRYYSQEILTQGFTLGAAISFVSVCYWLVYWKLYMMDVSLKPRQGLSGSVLLAVWVNIHVIWRRRNWGKVINQGAQHPQYQTPLGSASLNTVSMFVFISHEVFHYHPNISKCTNSNLSLCCHFLVQPFTYM